MHPVQTPIPSRFGDGLLASAKLAVEQANVKLNADSDAAAFVALLPCYRGGGVRSNLEMHVRMQLQCTGPLYQVPETVKRIHQLYERRRLTSVIDSPKVL